RTRRSSDLGGLRGGGEGPRPARARRGPAPAGAAGRLPRPVYVSPRQADAPGNAPRRVGAPFQADDVIAMTEPIPLLVLAGPTAAGKSELALRLARSLPIEVISADSAQVYRGLDIGTAKPTAEERRRVPHHLIDLIDGDRRFSVAAFQAAADAAARDIRRRGRIPVLVGGTGLYIRAVVQRFVFTGDTRDPEVRGALEA